MLNNGPHYLLEFSAERAGRLGVPRRGSIWPSSLKQAAGRHHLGPTSVLGQAEKVLGIEVSGYALKSVTVIKDRNPKKSLSVDIESPDWTPYDEDKLFKAILELK